ncbi:MFS transporter [Streptomyces hirsutus]
MVLMAISFMGGLFFVTFYLQNVHGLSPVDAGLHLLPLTGMMIVGSPLAGAVITKVGPRIPLAGGMAFTALAMFGISTLQKDTGSALMSLRFASCPGPRPGPRHGRRHRGDRGQRAAGALRRRRRSPAGCHAGRRQPRYGRAGRGYGLQGRQRPRGQLGGRGTPAPPTPEQAEQAAEAVQIGVPPVGGQMPPEMVATVTDVAHDTFISGMSTASLVATGVAVVAVGVALLTKRGENAEAGAGVGQHLTDPVTGFARQGEPMR